MSKDMSEEPASARDGEAAYVKQGPRHLPVPSRQRKVHLSSIDCPYLPAVHPAADDLHERTLQWARAMGLVRKPEHIQALDGSRVGHLVARVFPATTDLVALQLAVDWTTLFCCLDDHLEQIHGAVLTAAYLRGLLRVFRDGMPPHLTDPYSNAFGDLRERMLARRIPNWIPRFVASVERLFDAFVDEAKYRNLEVAPAFANYRQIRQITIGLYSGFLLSELTDGIVLPPEVLAHEHVRALEKTASDIVGLANDILTAEKEHGRGEVNNTVVVLMVEDGLSFDDALARTIQLHDAELREFSRLAADLPRFADEDTDQQLRRYVDFLATFISGHRDWARQTGRYAAVDAPILDEGDEEAAP